MANGACRDSQLFIYKLTLSSKYVDFSFRQNFHYALSKRMLTLRFPRVFFDFCLSVIFLSCRLCTFDLRGRFMRRREAVKVFKEICKCVPDAFVSSISLSPNTLSGKDFELRINVVF